MLSIAVRRALQRDWKEMGGMLFLSFVFFAGAAQFYDATQGKKMEPDYDAPRLR
jgi:hypothetical protein